MLAFLNFWLYYIQNIIHTHTQYLLFSFNLYIFIIGIVFYFCFVFFFVFFISVLFETYFFRWSNSPPHTYTRIYIPSWITKYPWNSQLLIWLITQINYSFMNTKLLHTHNHLGHLNHYFLSFYLVFSYFHLNS